MGWVTQQFSWNLYADLQSMLAYAYMVNAFEAGTIIAIVAGLVGYLIVLRKSSFAAHALGHVGFAGAAGAVLLSWDPVVGLLLFTTGSGTFISLLGKKAAHRDVEIGTTLAFMLGLGVLFISLYTGYSTETYSILFGEVLGISNSALQLTFYASLVVFALLAATYRPLLFSSLDEEVAEAKGLNTVFLGWIFMMLVAITVSIAVQVIGVLLIFALMVTPAATAIRLCKRPGYAIVVSVLIAVLSVWGGLFIAWYSNYPPSFFIVTISFVIYIAVRIGQYGTSKVRRALAADRGHDSSTSVS